MRNIFDSNCEVLVNPVNMVGVSGAGLAKQFAIRFPIPTAEYARYCHLKEIRNGRWVRDSVTTKVIYFFPTKEHWRAT